MRMVDACVVCIHMYVQAYVCLHRCVEATGGCLE